MSVGDMREKVIRTYLRTGKITEFFGRVDTGTGTAAEVTFSTIPHTDEEKR